MAEEQAFTPPPGMMQPASVGAIIDCAFPEMALDPGKPGKRPRLALLLSARCYGGGKIPAYTVLPVWKKIEDMLREEADPDQNRRSLQFFDGAERLLEDFGRVAELPVTSAFFPALFSGNAQGIFGTLSNEQMKIIMQQAEGRMVCNRHALQVHEISGQKARGGAAAASHHAYGALKVG